MTSASVLGLDRKPITAQELPPSSLDQHDQILLRLQDALQRSSLVQKFIEFRVCVKATHINSPKAYYTELSSESIALIETRRELKSAATDFLRRAPKMTPGEAQLIERLELHSLLYKSTWMKILTNGPPAYFDKWMLDSYYKKLLYLQDYVPSQPSIVELEEQCKSALNSTKQIQQKKYKATVKSLALCTLILCLVIFGFAKWTPSFSQSVLQVIQTQEAALRTTIVLLIIILSVYVFKLLTNFPVYPETHPSTRTNKAASFSTSPKRLLAGIIGPLILGFGSGASVSAGFGTFGVTVMFDGIYQTYGVPYWVTQPVFSIACYVLAWKWAKIPLGLGTVPALLLIGPAISFGATITPQDLSFIGNLAAFFIGTFVIATGIAMSTAAALGPDAKVSLSLAAEKTCYWPIPQSTLFFNTLFILIGIALAGNFGIATVINLFAVPALLKYLVPPLRRHLKE